MEKLKIHISYSKGKKILLTDTFSGAIEMMLTSETLKKYEPIKLFFPDWNKVMCFDRSLFTSFHKGDIDYEDVINRALCDQMYRNVTDLNVEENIIRKGSLWKCHGEDLTLIDDTKIIHLKFNEDLFEIAQ